MANLKKIKALAQERNMSLESIAKELEITPQALSKLMRVNSTTIETLERISLILNVSPTIFFEDSQERQYAYASCNSSAIAGNGNVQSNKNERLIDLVEKQVAQLNQMIEKKDEQIDRLLSLLENINPKNKQI